MKLKPSDFDWEKYDYHIDWVGCLRSGVEALDCTPVSADDPPNQPAKWNNTGYVRDSLNLVRVPKPEPVYQLLPPGTLIREGDEMSLGGDDRWKKAVGLCGFSAARNEIWRRKLPEGTKLP